MANDLRVKVRKSWIDGAWHIRVTTPEGAFRAHLIWPGNAARNWFGLMGAVDMALDRARKTQHCPGTPHRGHTEYKTPCPLEVAL